MVQTLLLLSLFFYSDTYKIQPFPKRHTKISALTQEQSKKLQFSEAMRYAKDHQISLEKALIAIDPYKNPLQTFESVFKRDQNNSTKHSNN